ncbi:MAG: hypothetical protein CBD18_09265 [Opitutales bacterium TMED158]|nr:MAG: hypothetical protein CBD18_09265 [Opitutales bacterium TMED158]
MRDMKLRANSRYILELLAALGSEAVQGFLRFPRFYKTVGCSSEDLFWRRSKALSERGLLTTSGERATGNWVATLTSKASETLSDGIEPETEWNTPWDKHWRLFAFDLPQNSGAQRQALRLWLKQRRFGKLQGSLWITPKRLDDWAGDLDRRKIDPNAVALMNGTFEGKGSPQSYARSSWNFALINERYQAYLDFLEARDPQTVDDGQFSDWFQSEIALWRKAFDLDPFLPRELWPKPYLGPQAYDARAKAFADWKSRLLG